MPCLQPNIVRSVATGSWLGLRTYYPVITWTLTPDSWLILTSYLLISLKEWTWGQKSPTVNVCHYSLALIGSFTAYKAWLGAEFILIVTTTLSNEQGQYWLESPFQSSGNWNLERLSYLPKAQSQDTNSALWCQGPHPFQCANASKRLLRFHWEKPETQLCPGNLLWSKSDWPRTPCLYPISELARHHQKTDPLNWIKRMPTWCSKIS